MKRLILIVFLLCSFAWAGDLTLYVSTDGNDSNTGTDTAHPLKTIDKARQLVAGQCTTATLPIIVNIDASPPDLSHPDRPRTYYQGTDLGVQLKFVGSQVTYPAGVGQGDSGCTAAHPIIYQAWKAVQQSNGQWSKAFISGGMRATGWTATGYTGSGFTQYQYICNSPCTDTEVLFVNGQRHLRARFGAAAISGTVTTSGTAVTKVSGTAFNGLGQWNNAVLNIKGVDYQVASTTDTSHVTLKTSAGTQIAVPYSAYNLSNIGGRYLLASNGDSPTCPLGSGQCSIVSPTDACSLGTSYGCSGGTNANCPTATSGACKDRIRMATSVSLAGLTPINLSATTDCTANSQHNFDTLAIVIEDFTSAIMRICAVDQTNNLVIMSGSFTDTGGGGSYGPIDKHGVIFENFADSSGHFISLPQQWYMDRTVTPPVIYYNAAVGENPNADIVDIGVIAQAAKFFNVQYITLRGLMFGEDNWLVDNAGVTSTDSQPRLPGAVSLADTNFINVENVDIAHTSGDGAEIYQCRSNAEDPSWCINYIVGSTAHDVNWHGGSFYDIGSSGLQISNRLVKFDSYDSDTTVPYNVWVTDSLFDGNGRRVPGGGPLISSVWHDGYVIHNEIHDSYHEGIAYCGSNCNFGATGHGMYSLTTSLNLLYDIEQGVMGDIGALYNSNGNGTRKPVGTCAANNLIWMNVIHDVNDMSVRPEANIGSAGDGIYLDNMTCNVDVWANVVYRTSQTCFRNTEGVPLFGGDGFDATIAQGASGPNTWRNNVCAYTRVGAYRTAAASMWRQAPDFAATGHVDTVSATKTVNWRDGVAFSSSWVGSTISVNLSLYTIAGVSGTHALTVTTDPGTQTNVASISPNCPAGDVRLQTVFKNNLAFTDRDDTATLPYYFQAGSPDTCGNTMLATQLYSANQWYSTLHTDLNAYAKAFHVVHATGTPADAPSPANNTAAQWDFATSGNWQSGAAYTNNGGGASTPVVTSVGEDSGSVFNSNPGFASAGYPNDNYTLTCPLALAAFNCTPVNYALAHAGRLTNTGFNPIVPRTFSTAILDPAHTNNGDY